MQGISEEKIESVPMLDAFYKNVDTIGVKSAQLVFGCTNQEN